MRYVVARFDEYSREEAYRIYVARSLQLIPQNKYIPTNFYDIIKVEKTDNRSGDEIVLDTMRKAGLSFGEQS